MMPRLIRPLVLLAALVACGGGSGDTPTPAPTPTLSVATSLGAATVTRSASATAQITITRGGNFSAPVSLSATGVPAGVVVSFDPSTLASGITTSTVTFTATTAALAVSAPIVITASGTGVAAASATVLLNVIAPSPSISVVVGATVALARSGSASIPVIVTRGGGYTDQVTLAVSGLPVGVVASFAPSTLSAGMTASTLTFTASSSAAIASSVVTVTASGTGVGTITSGVSVTVGAAPALALTSLGLGAVPERYTAEVWVRGTTAYTTSWGTRGATRGNAIKIWDVGANAPVLLDSVLVANAGTLGDVQVSDDGTLLVAGIEPTPNGGLAVYALDTPRSPRLLARTTGGELQYGVHTAEIARVNGVLYAFCSVDPANGVPARLVIVSLANPVQPTTVASIQMGSPFIHDVFVRDGLLFTGEWNDGVGIWDIGGGGTGGTVAVPKRMSRTTSIGGKVHNMWWFHDPTTSSKRYLFVGEEGPGAIGSSSVGDMHVFDVSSLTAPMEIARYTVPGAGVHNFSVDEANGLLYAAFYNGGVRAVDVRGDLSACSAAQRLGDGRCDLTLMGREKGAFAQSGLYVWGVHWSTSGVFASDMLNGLWRITPAVR